MAFDVTKHTIDQLPGPRCGAACAVYVLDWLKDRQTTGWTAQGAAVAAAMKATGTTALTPNLGSTPANIANYIKKKHPAAKISAPTEMITNWSTRIWMPVLRPFLILNASTSIRMGFKPTGCNLGVDTMIIRMMTKKIYKLGSIAAYFEAHFVVKCGDQRYMDPDGGVLETSTEFKDKNWASVGLDLYVQK